MCDSHQPLNGADSAAPVTHQVPPDGSGLMPCCGRTPVPGTDRMTADARLVTCTPEGARYATREEFTKAFTEAIEQLTQGEAAPALTGLPTPLGGIVACGVEGCGGKVTTHYLLRLAKSPGALRMPERPLYFCDDHVRRTELYGPTV